MIARHETGPIYARMAGLASASGGDSLAVVDGVSVPGKREYENQLAGIENAKAEVERQADFLMQPLGPPPADDAEYQQRLAAIADYWWVEIEDADGWRRLDPAPWPDGPPPELPAKSYLDVDESQIVTASLPSELFHNFDIKVIIEKSDGTALSEQVVLAHNIAPAGLGDKPLQLSVMPTPGRLSTEIRIHNGDMPAAFMALDEWQPALQIGKQVIRGERFDEKGNVLGGKPAAASGGGLLGDVFNKIGEEIELRSDGVLPAAWLEYTIHSPGLPDDVVRRRLFDFVGFAIADAQTKQVMTEAAEAAQGRFFDVRDSDSLAAALRRSFGKVTYEVSDASGAVINSGELNGDATQLRPGQYSAGLFVGGGPVRWQNIKIAAGRATTMDVRPEDGHLVAYFADSGG